MDMIANSPTHSKEGIFVYGLAKGLNNGAIMLYLREVGETAQPVDVRLPNISLRSMVCLNGESL